VAQHKKRQPPAKRPTTAPKSGSGATGKSTPPKGNGAKPKPAAATPAPAELEGGATTTAVLDDEVRPKVAKAAREVTEPEKLTLLDWFTLGATFLVFVAFLPNIFDYYRVPRLALMAVLLGPGLVLLVLRAVKRDLASIAAIGFLLWTALSTAMADEPRNALWGVFSDGALYTLAAYLAVWALGAELSPKARQLLPMTIIAGVSATALVGFLQVISLDGQNAVERWVLRTFPSGFGDRASGLTGNPVILGGAMACGVVVLIGWFDRWDNLKARRPDELPYRWLLLLGFFVGMLNLSGSRIAFLAVLPLAVVALMRLRMALIVSAVIAMFAGLLFSLAVASASGSAGSGASTNRVAEGGGVMSRITAWQAGLEGMADEPLFGWGPGRYQAASSPYLTEDFVKAEGLNKVFTSAHNILVEFIANLGVIGFALFGAWLVLAAMNARGTLALGALAIFFTLLLQPLSVMTIPVAVVVLGAADPTNLPRRVRPKVPVLAGMGVLATLGLLWGAVYVYSDYVLGKALKGFSQGLAPEKILDYVDDADRLRVNTSEFEGVKSDVAIKVANLVASQGGDATEFQRGAIETANGAVAFDSYYPGWLNFQGATEADWGNLDTARASFERSLERFPWSEAALTGMLIVTTRQGDTEKAAEIDAKLCVINSPNCSTNRAAAEAAAQQQAPQP